MSLEDFWINVRTAGQGGDPRLLDRHPFDRQAVLDSLRNRADWLTEETVEGFDERDFDCLDPAARAELASAVASFKRALADPASSEQAVESLVRILELMEFPRFGNPEGFRLGKLIDRELGADRPECVADYRVVAGIDHTDDPALNIWVFVKEGDSSDTGFLENARIARKRLDKAVLRVIRNESRGGRNWMYYIYMYSVDDLGSSRLVPSEMVKA